jgi:hypothetical protein
VPLEGVFDLGAFTRHAGTVVARLDALTEQATAVHG